MSNSRLAYVLTIATQLLAGSSARAIANEPDPEAAGAEEIIVTDDPPPWEDWLRLTRAAVEEAALILDVQYGGGCRDHEIGLYWDGRLSDTVPEEVTLHVRHDAKGDRCLALLMRQLAFDLTPIRESTNRSVVIHIEGSGVSTELRLPGEMFVYLNAGESNYTVVLGPDETTIVDAVLLDGQPLRVDEVGSVVMGTVEDGRLVVTRVTGEAGKYWLRDAGIRCVTSPCPTLELVDIYGNRLRAADLELASNIDSEKLEPRMLAAPRGVRVRGFVAEGSWRPQATGNVVTVTSYEIVGAEPAACWGAWTDGAGRCRTSTDRFYPPECCGR